MTESNKSAADKQLGVNEKGDCWVYANGSAAGYVEVELPTLPGSPNPTERLHLRDFGGVVVEKIESAMQCTYLTKQSPAQVFRHYATVAKGASLMDEGALKRMETLAQDFEREPEQEEFFKQVIRPYLHGLKPGKRQP